MADKGSLEALIANIVDYQEPAGEANVVDIVD